MRKNMKLMITIFYLIFLIGTLHPQELPQRGICAHRGANNTHPENTIAAFREAVRLGAHMIEFDVQMSRDSVLVIMHDKTVDRTTNGHGETSELTLIELKYLDAGSWKNNIYKDERIPTLQETLEMMPTNIWLNVHIKDSDKIGIAVARLIVAKNRKHQAIIACKPETAAAIKKIDQHIKICNMERRDNSIRYVNETLAFNSEFIQLKERSDPFLSTLIPQLKQNGVRINYFGTNSAEKLKQLFTAGIDFPLVDDVSSMMKIADELDIKAVRPIFGEKND